MLLLLLTLLSMIAGGALFVTMIGNDAWLIKGLRRDSFAASIVTCVLLTVAIGLYVALRAFLPMVPELVASAFASDNPAASDKIVEAGSLLDAVKWIVLLCIPILVSLILYCGYTGFQWLARRTFAGGYAAASRVSNQQ